MEKREIWKKIKKAWNWIWNSDSFLSWIVALAIIFVFVKFIFFPGLGFILGTSLPLAGVESSSMDHQIVRENNEKLSLCGNYFSRNDKQYINFDEYWDYCGNWYEENGITKKEFSEFHLKNGFRKGDIIVVWGRFKPKVGDIIIFKPNPDSTAPRPIIHRIVKIDEYIKTKGDHNERQLTSSNNIYGTDETKIRESQIIGKAIIKIPLLGWVKIWITEFIEFFI
ncbi:hypothetical protein GF386_04410 [Candidatus Pacearchaeota archaeon]|nr:hypothetical protein [Candidatus Pacearchaeota archaeon]MBD3283367.1 hypothetical protein [Candidatus Pacearchaeota archaeon]